MILDVEKPTGTLGEIQIEALKHDLDLHDRYQGFSAEILRISLLGITAIGFLIANVLLVLSPKENGAQTTRTINLAAIAPEPFKLFASLSLISFGLASAASLSHRYFAADAMACHLRAVRLFKRGRESDDDEGKKEAGKRKLEFGRSAL
jgi:hypothetical protein